MVLDSAHSKGLLCGISGLHKKLPVPYQDGAKFLTVPEV